MRIAAMEINTNVSQKTKDMIIACSGYLYHLRVSVKESTYHRNTYTAIYGDNIQNMKSVFLSTDNK